MGLITFKAKAYESASGEMRVKIPAKFNENHIDRKSFETSRKFWSCINSQLFPALLERTMIELGIVNPNGHRSLSLENPPSVVDIDRSGFLTIVTLHIGE